MKALAVLVALCLLCLPLRAADDDEAPPGPRYARCRLAYDYDARDGMLTCAAYDRFWTFYPHPAARRARRLPAGARVILEYAPGERCGAGCWLRIVVIER